MVKNQKNRDKYTLFVIFWCLFGMVPGFIIILALSIAFGSAFWPVELLQALFTIFAIGSLLVPLSGFVMSLNLKDSSIKILGMVLSIIGFFSQLLSFGGVAMGGTRFIESTKGFNHMHISYSIDPVTNTFSLLPTTLKLLLLTPLVCFALIRITTYFKVPKTKKWKSMLVVLPLTALSFLDPFYLIFFAASYFLIFAVYQISFEKTTKCWASYLLFLGVLKTLLAFNFISNSMS